MVGDLKKKKQDSGSYSENRQREKVQRLKKAILRIFGNKIGVQYQAVYEHFDADVLNISVQKLDCDGVTNRTRYGF
jgi:hypothetical protein